MGYFNNTNTPSRGLNHAESNHNNASEYLVSSVPWVTASRAAELKANNTHPIKITFPRVTRFVRVFNPTMPGGSGGALKFGFTRLGVASGSNFAYVPNGGNLRLKVKCLEMHLDVINPNDNVGVGFIVMAGLTSVPPHMFLDLTGSEGVVFDGVG